MDAGIWADMSLAVWASPQSAGKLVAHPLVVWKKG
jgi:hypothetical protein